MSHVVESRSVNDTSGKPEGCQGTKRPPGSGSGDRPFDHSKGAQIIQKNPNLFSLPCHLPLRDCHQEENKLEKPCKKR